MVFHITFMLVLFYDKKYCNCILWDLIVMDLVLSDEDLLKNLILRLGSRVVQPVRVTGGAYAGS